MVTEKHFVFIQGWGFHWLEIPFHLFLFGIRVWSDSAQIAEQQQKPNSCRVWAKKNSETSHERLFLALFDFLFCFTHYFECLRSTKVNARKLFFFFSKAKQKRKSGEKNLWLKMKAQTRWREWERGCEERERHWKRKKKSSTAIMRMREKI